MQRMERIRDSVVRYINVHLIIIIIIKSPIRPIFDLGRCNVGALQVCLQGVLVSIDVNNHG